MDYATRRLLVASLLVAALLGVTPYAAGRAYAGSGANCARAAASVRAYVTRSDTRRLSRCTLSILEHAPAIEVDALCAAVHLRGGAVHLTDERSRRRLERRCQRGLPEWLQTTCAGPGPTDGAAITDASSLAECVVTSAHCFAVAAASSLFPDFAPTLAAQTPPILGLEVGRDRLLAFADCLAPASTTSTSLPGTTTTVGQATTTTLASATTVPAPTTTLASATTTTVADVTTTLPSATSLPAPTTTLAVATTTLAAPTTTIPIVTTTVLAPTTTLASATTTLASPTTTLGTPTTTLPVVTTTLALPTTTLQPATTTTVGAPTTTVLVTTTSLAPTTTLAPVTSTTTPAPTTTTTLPAPSSPMLVVTEIMSNPAVQSDTAGEYIELRNVGSQPLELFGLVVRDAASDTFSVNHSLVVAAGAYVVLGRSATAAHGAVDYVYGTAMTLANTADKVILVYGGVELDRVEYDARFPLLAGRATELRASAMSATLNDLPASWCASSAALGDGDFGTPRATSSCAP